MATMSDVARLAGVSVSTVSHVVNGTRRVPDGTRTKVLAAMRTLNFEQTPHRRSLSSGVFPTIGLVMSTPSNPYWSALVSAIDSAIAKAGLNLLIVDSRDEPSSEARAVANLLAHHVEGLIVAPTTAWDAETSTLLREHPRPYVVVDRSCSLPVDQVTVDNVAAASRAVGHLLDLGHRRVALIGGARNVVTSLERQRGYVDAHLRRDVEIDAELVTNGESTVDGAARAATRLLALKRPPTAVFVANNSMTIGAMRAMRDAGLRVPTDVALTCFDDHPWTSLFSPRLTTIAQPNDLIGAASVNLLLRRLKDGSAPPRHIKLETTFVHGESCGCAR